MTHAEGTLDLFAVKRNPTPVPPTMPCPTPPADMAGLIRAWCEALRALPLDEQVAALNAARRAMHEAGPFAAEPVDLVQWVKHDDVFANDYNPNSVAPPEMELLRTSITADGYTQPIVAWEREGGRSFVELLLTSLPAPAAERFRAKIDVFRKWWMDRKDRPYGDGIPDEADPKLEGSRKAPSWRRIAKCILRNDYWCKGLSFTQHKTGAYERYLAMMKKRKEKAEWRLDDREKRAVAT